MPSKVWDEITYPFPNFSGCAVEVWKMDKLFHTTLYNWCNYLSILWLKLINVSKRGLWSLFIKPSIRYSWLILTFLFILNHHLLKSFGAISPSFCPCIYSFFYHIGNWQNGWDFTDDVYFLWMESSPGSWLAISQCIFGYSVQGTNKYQTITWTEDG